MSRHLTEQQLIDYQFKLADEAGLDEARAHLDECESCRRELQRLVRKFAALDLLRDEAMVSEALLAKTVANAVPPRRSHILWLYRIPALGAVAAAVIVGLALLLVSDSGQNKRNESALTQDQPAQKVASTPSSENMPSLGTEQLATGRRAVQDTVALAPSSRPERVEPKTALAAAPAPNLVMGQVAEVRDEQEQPPFAPASAIELVVLPRRENVQLTIYNGADLTLVRERRNLTLKRGWNWLQFMWANTLIDPTSLALEPLEHQQAVQVQQLVFPPRLQELGRWLIHSEIGGQVPFELTYFTSGLAWRAFYMGTLSQDETTMRLAGYIRISNGSGEDYEDAQTRLLVGRVHLLDEIRALAQRAHPYGSPISDLIAPGKGLGGGRFYGQKIPILGDVPLLGRELREVDRQKDIIKEGLSEYFLYTIEGTETIPNTWGKRLLSFAADDIPVVSLYKYDQERWGTQTARFLSFANDEQHKLGQTPIPDGTVRIYGRAGEQDHLAYVGAMAVKYIPVGEEIELNLGPARLVEVRPVLMDYRTESHSFDNRGNLSGWDEVRTWKIEVANTRTLPVEVEVTRGFGTPYWTLRQANQDAAYEKHDATHARFKLTVAPRSKRTFEYTVTTCHGVRKESMSK
jgi:hypothetical protein